MEITKSMYLLAKKIVAEYEEGLQTKIKLPTKTIEERIYDFKLSLKPYIGQYSVDMIKEFYEYWTEHSANDRKFRKELEKKFNLALRLETWHRRSKEFKKSTNNSNGSIKQTAAQIIHNVKNGTYEK